MVNYIAFKADLESGTNAHLTLWVLPDEIAADQLDKLRSILEEFKYYQVGARFKAFDNFGPNKDIPVIKVKGELLFAAIRKRLTDAGITDASSYEYVPHITVPTDMDPIIIPRVIWCGFIYAKINETVMPN